MKFINIIFIVIAIFALGIGGYFVRQNQDLLGRLHQAAEEAAELQETKAALTTELAVLKATDLAKEADVLNLKLKTAERDVATKEKEIAAALREKASVTVQLQTARANSTKIRSRLDAIDATERMVGAGPNAGTVATVDQKIAAVKDAGITEAWAAAKQDIDFTRMSWNGNTIADAVIAITRSIRNLLP